MKNSITLTDAQIERLSAIYADTTNKDICAEFQISLSILYKYTKKLGLSKSQEFMDKAKSGKMKSAAESKTDSAPESKKYFRFRDRWKQCVREARNLGICFIDENGNVEELPDKGADSIKKNNTDTPKIVYSMDKIKDKTIFCAVACAIKLMSKAGMSAAKACSVSAQRFDVNVSKIAHYVGQRAQRIKQYRYDKDVIFYDFFKNI